MKIEKLIRVPLKFYLDHKERDLDTPRAVRFTSAAVFVKASDPAIAELLDDAKYYAASAKHMDGSQRGLCMSAAATVKAIQAAL